MRISPITNAYRQNLQPQKRDVNFGRILDKNAYQVVDDALLKQCGEWEHGYYNAGYLHTRAPYVDIYTNNQGRVVGKFTKEFLNSEYAQKHEYYINVAMSRLEDMSDPKAAYAFALAVDTINKDLSGVVEEPKSSSSDGYDSDRRQEERAEYIAYW